MRIDFRIRQGEKAMATTMTAPALMPPVKNRGKEQIGWGDDIWNRLDAAVTDEMIRTRVAAKFLPLVQVPKKVTTVHSDVVITPPAGATDQALSVDESQTSRVNEFWVEFRLTPAQEEHERSEEMAMNQGQGASTGISLAIRSANILAQVEDTVLLNGQNAFNSPLFATGGLVQFRDPNLRTNLDLGLLNIDLNGVIPWPDPRQIVLVSPASQGPRRYANNTLDAIAAGFSILQSLGHYEHYAGVFHTEPYADLHQALPTTLITPVEPVSHILKAGVYGTGTLPPFNTQTAGLPDPNNLLEPRVLRPPLRRFC